MLVGRGCEVAGDKAGPGGHGAGMRWVLMLFVIFAAVMGGEARAAVVMGRVEVSEGVEKAAVARESGALRIVLRGTIEDAEAAAGVLNAGPLVCWFPGGSAVARSDCGDIAVNVRHAAGTLDRGGLMFDSHEERGAGMWTYMTLKRSTMESGHANGQLEHMRRAAIVQFDNWQNQYYEGGADAAKLGLINAMDFTGAGDAAYNGKSALEVAARIGVGGLSVAFGGAALGAMRGTYAAGSAAGAMGLASAGSDLVLQGGLGVVDAIAGNEVKPYSWTQTAGAFFGGAVVGKLAGRLGGAKCFAAGTDVETPGGEKDIEDIKAGDTVYAYDFETGLVVERRVLETVSNYTHYWADVEIAGDVLHATRGHKFWVESAHEWIEAAELKPGMVVRLSNGEFGSVSKVSVWALAAPETTYNLIVEEEHNYFVGDHHVLVHNGYPENPQYPPATRVGETFQFNFDTSLNYKNSRAAGVDRAKALGLIDPTDIGHHINTVHTHTHLAAEPSNIAPEASRNSHFKTHGNNWRKPTTGPLNAACQ